MDTVMSEEKLKEVFDQTLREVTKRSGGIQLVHRDCVPGHDLCTVHISFQKGFHSSLSLRADSAMLTRLTQSILRVEHVTLPDLEDVTKEYFNVLCGNIARALYKATRVASRFNVPSFFYGSFSPEGHRTQFILSYSSDREEAVQLIHHIPDRLRRKAGERTEAPANQIRQPTNNTTKR